MGLRVSRIFENSDSTDSVKNRERNVCETSEMNEKVVKDVKKADIVLENKKITYKESTLSLFKLRFS